MKYISPIYLLLLVSIIFTGACSSSDKKESAAKAEETTATKKTLNDFGIRATNVFLYYKDVDAAAKFYTETLGMEQIADYTMAKILRVAADSYIILVDASQGMHTAEEPKTVAIALLTDQLDEWYDYLLDAGIKMKYEYKPKDSSAHDGFVFEDPEGYLLEFERFNEHPENKNFTPILNQAKTITSPNRDGVKVPAGLGFKATITWLYYRDILAMQEFYEMKFGLTIVADQGWTKILKVTNTGYIGLVDEQRGMHSYTIDKAVTLSFIIDDLDGWYSHVKENHIFAIRSDSISTGPEGKYRAFVGYDPEGYYLEFDTFYPHSENELVMKYLGLEE